jgi:hypothetical protein
VILWYIADPRYKLLSNNRGARELAENGRFLTTAHAKRRIRFDAETATYWVRDGALRDLKWGPSSGSENSGDVTPISGITPPVTPLPTVKSPTAVPPISLPPSHGTGVEIKEIPSAPPTSTASPSSPSSSPSAPKKKRNDDDELIVTAERDQLYCLALAHILYCNHNGNKNGPVGIYPDRKSQRADIQIRDPKISASVQMYQVHICR